MVRARTGHAALLTPVATALLLLLPTPPATADPAACTPTTDLSLGFVTLPDGVSLEYAERGSGRGQVVLFLHGYTDSWFSFSEVIPRLPSRYHAYALSQRDHGDSDQPPTGYATADFADDVVAFMDHSCIRRAAVVGHSMGSVIALRLALDHPQRVSELVLVGAAAGAAGSPVLAEVQELADGLVDPIDPALVLAFQASTVFNPVPASFLERAVRESLKVPARAWQAAITGLVAADYRAELPSVEARTLIVWGDRDTIFPLSDQLDLEAGIPAATLLVYPDVGHGLHREQPGRFAADLAAFLQ